MTYLLTEKDFVSLVKECVKGIIKNGDSNIIQSLLENAKKNSLILETGTERKKYKRGIENLAQQLIENIALIRHCYISGDMNNRVHWSDELSGHLKTLLRSGIRFSKHWEDKEKAVREVWKENLFWEPDIVERQIANKFRREGFDIRWVEFLQVIDDCVKLMNPLIYTISHGEVEDIGAFVKQVNQPVIGG